MIKDRKLVFKTYISLILTLILLAFLLWTNSYIQNQIPDCYEVRSKEASAGYLSYDEYNDLHLNKSCAYLETSLQNKIISEGNLKFVLTDHNFAQYYNLEIIAGQFFTRSIVSLKQHYAVISENLALELFLSHNVIGQKMIIEGYEYEIIGVYKSEMNYYSKLSQDIYERIYLPYTTISSSGDMKITSIIFTFDDKVYSNVDKLFLKYPYLKYYTEQINYNQKLNYVTQFPSWLIFFFQAYIIILLITIGYKVVKGKLWGLSNQSHDYYLKELIKENYRQIILSALIIVACFVGIFFLITNLSIRVSMSNWFMPEDNLFDISHYLNRILEFFIDKNTYRTPGNNYYTNLVDITLFASIFTIIILVPLLVMFIDNFRKLSKSNIVLAVELIIYLLVLLILSMINSSISSMHAAGMVVYIILTLGIIVVKNIHKIYIK